MKHDKRQTHTEKTSEEMAESIAHLKGKELEDYIAETTEVIGIMTLRLQDRNLSEKMRRAYTKTKKALEDILKIVEADRTN